MSVKLLLLKSGEDVVADVQEMVVNENVVGYYLRYPCRVKLVSSMDAVSDGQQKVGTRIQLQPWMPLSKESIVSVVADWVVTITEPVSQLVQMYEDGVNKYEIEQSEASGAE